MFIAALSHDVDRVKKTYQYLTSSLKKTIKFNFSGLGYELKSVFGPEPYWNFDRIIKIEEKHDVKSTFFILDESIKFDLFNRKNWQLSLGRYRIDDPKIADVIRQLDINGWEIGLHGSYNSFNDTNLLQKEKKRIEDIIGHNLIGIRQHYLNLTNNTWEIQKKSGLLYDASFGYNNAIGYKDNKYSLFNPFNDKFTVFPLAIMDICFMAIENKWDAFKKIVKLTEEKSGILVLNWHQRVFNENEFPQFAYFYEKMIVYMQEQGAEIQTLGKIYHQQFDKNNSENG